MVLRGVLQLQTLMQIESGETVQVLIIVVDVLGSIDEVLL